MRTPTAHADVETCVQAIMAPFRQPWRWFCDGAWVVLQPPLGFIAAETMQYVHQHADVHTVEAVFRGTPSPGIYLRFQLRALPAARQPLPAARAIARKEP